MREIKFRAWSKTKKTMFYQDSHYGHIFQFSKAGGGHLFLNDIRETDIIMQYTGCEDKIGKDIYEGDIVKNWSGLIGFVKWSETRFCFVVKYDKRYGGINYCLEVIGNIYENKGMLTKRGSMKLKPCPFCGQTPDWFYKPKSHYGYVIFCTYCKCQTNDFHDEQDAITAWNRRAK